MAVRHRYGASRSQVGIERFKVVMILRSKPILHMDLARCDRHYHHAVREFRETRVGRVKGPATGYEKRTTIHPGGTITGHPDSAAAVFVIVVRGALSESAAKDIEL